MMPVLISLGVWQLNRAAEKQALLDRWQAQVDTLPWAEVARRPMALDQPVRVTGHYDDAIWLLDNRTRDGRPGYEVINRFVPDLGPAVLVNRGWVPAPARRDQLPEVSVPTAPVTLAGRLADYPEPPVLGDEAEPGDWPRRVQRLPRTVAEASVGPLTAYLIRLRDDTQPGAFRADWAPEMMGPTTHYGYAAQWFSLAVVLAVLTWRACRPPRRPGSNAQGDGHERNPDPL